MTNGTIYIVDDNAETAQSLAFFLESLGWRTRVWNDPETFLIDYEELAADGCFIFDIRMPKIDGLELLERLNAKGNKRPIIILTGHGDVNMAVKAFKNGAFDFFLKPPAEKELIEAVEKALTVSRSVSVLIDEQTISAGGCNILHEASSGRSVRMELNIRQTDNVGMSALS